MPEYIIFGFVRCPAVSYSGYGEKSLLYEVEWHMDHTEFLFLFNHFKVNFMMHSLKTLIRQLNVSTHILPKVQTLVLYYVR
jgi:hypothetical protein